MIMACGCSLRTQSMIIKWPQLPADPRGPGSKFPRDLGTIALTVVSMRGVPWWGIVSSAATPVLLVSGWMIAADLQPQPFDPFRQSVSSLAGAGADERWVMTLAFIVVAGCYVTTALALRPAALAGRLVLIAAGLAGMLVAASPDAAPGGFSLAHAFWSALGFAFLAGWPLAARRPGRFVPWALRSTAAVCASALIIGLLAWFLVELVTGGSDIGLAERVLGCAQATWPLLVVLSCRHAIATVSPEIRQQPSRQPQDSS